nr:unnamed protein product [Callosobruchus chinensis]
MYSKSWKNISDRKDPDTSIGMDGSENQPSTSSTKRMKYDAVRPLSDEKLLKIIDDISTESDVEFEIEGSDENGSDEENDLQPSTEVSEADNRTWLVDRPDLGKIPFSGNAGLKLNPDGDQPIDFFNLLLNDNFFELVSTIMLLRYSHKLLAISLG